MAIFISIQTRIEHLADQKVGGTTGSGLSGGQVREIDHSNINTPYSRMHLTTCEYSRL